MMFGYVPGDMVFTAGSPDDLLIVLARDWIACVVIGARLTVHYYPEDELIPWSRRNEYK